MRFASLSSIICILNQLFGIDLVLIGEDLNEIDEGQDAADTKAAAHNNLENTLLGFAHHKVVDTKAAKEEANKGDGDLVFAAQIAVKEGRCFFGVYAAAQTNVGVCRKFFAAVVAESGACANFDAALHADFLIIIDLNTTVFTICHFRFPPKME